MKYIEKIKNMNTDAISSVLAGVSIETVRTIFKTTGEMFSTQEYMEMFNDLKKMFAEALESEVEE